MRIAVAGGTGLVGRRLVAALKTVGHEPVALSALRGIDLSMVVSWGPATGALVPPLLVQPVAIDDVVDLLTEGATDPPRQAAWRSPVRGPRTWSTWLAARSMRAANPSS